MKNVQSVKSSMEVEVNISLNISSASSHKSFIYELYLSLFIQSLMVSHLHSGSLLKAATQLALGCHWLVLEVCLLVGVNDTAVSVPMLDALAAAVVSEGVAGLRVLHLPVTVHWRNLMDLD